MNQNELNEILAGMDEEERRLTLNADDAYDALYAYRLHKEYGVEVVCNPGGDRTKISIDGVIMNQVEFSRWLFGKQMEKMGREIADGAGRSVSDGRKADLYEEDDELPESIEIDFGDEDYEGWDFLDDEELTLAYVKKYLRDSYNHYLAKGSNPTIDIDLDDEIIYVNDIEWGRKR